MYPYFSQDLITGLYVTAARWLALLFDYFEPKMVVGELLLKIRENTLVHI